MVIIATPSGRTSRWQHRWGGVAGMGRTTPCAGGECSSLDGALEAVGAGRAQCRAVRWGISFCFLLVCGADDATTEREIRYQLMSRNAPNARHWRRGEVADVTRRGRSRKRRSRPFYGTHLHATINSNEMRGKLTFFEHERASSFGSRRPRDVEDATRIRKSLETGRRSILNETPCWLPLDLGRARALPEPAPGCP